jgi:hypothetical protein
MRLNRIFNLEAPVSASRDRAGGGLVRDGDACCDHCGGALVARDGEDLRCKCGNLLGRRVAGGLELKCRRCKRTVVLPLEPEVRMQR